MAINRDRKPVLLLLFFALSKNTEDIWTRLMEEKRNRSGLWRNTVSIRSVGLWARV